MSSHHPQSSPLIPLGFRPSENFGSCLMLFVTVYGSMAGFPPLDGRKIRDELPMGPAGLARSCAPDLNSFANSIDWANPKKDASSTRLRLWLNPGEMALHTAFPIHHWSHLLFKRARWPFASRPTTSTWSPKNPNRSKRDQRGSNFQSSQQQTNQQKVAASLHWGGCLGPCPCQRFPAHGRQE